MAEELPDAPWVAESPAPPSALPDAPWVTQDSSLPDFPAPKKEEEAPPEPMPGLMESIASGAKAGWGDISQSAQAISGTTPEARQPDQTPAAKPWELADISSPSRGLSKAGYQIAHSWPTLTGGVGGGAAGSLLGPVGGTVGGITGAAIGTAFQTIGPKFAEELKKSPSDPDGAWTRAVESATISGAASGASWALFPLKIPGVQGILKNLAFQTFGVQPAVSMTERLSQNILEGKPATEGLGESYAAGAVGTALPLAAHMTLTKPAVQAPVAGPLSTGRISDAYKRTFQPELVSDKALQADPQFAQYKAASAQEKDAIINQAEEHYYRWNKIPERDQLRFMDAYERGQNLPPDLLAAYPWMQDRADAYRQSLKQAYHDEAMYGSKAGYIEDYLPHIWKEPDRAAQVFENLALPQNLGPKWFQKARHYDLIEEGLNAGLELKTTNPEELVTNRLLSGADMRMRMELLNNLQAMGLAVPAKAAPPSIRTPSFRNIEPWQQINAPNREAWMIAPDVQPLWQNAVNAQGLWSNPGAAGNAFRGWMALKNAWVPVKLALSAFHPLHVAHISISNNISRALNETFGGGQQSALDRIRALPEAATQSVFDMALAMPVGFPYRGKAAREAWNTPPRDQTPEQRATVQLMTEGGFSPQLSEQLRIAAKRKISDAMRNHQYWKAIPQAARRTIELLQKPIFEQWIPNLKAAAYLREAESAFRRYPDLMNDPLRRGVALRAIGKQIDNRFGEMFYGGLFWDRTLKDVAIGSFLSLGWNLGFVREFGGGALEPIARRLTQGPTPTRQLIRNITNKSTNAFVYTATAMAINGMINYAKTGEFPEGWDYVFPRVGGNNPDGSPRRITNMFYTREVPMAKKNIEERQSIVGGLTQMLYHKMMVAPFVEAYNNRDYFGYQMYDENAPWWKQFSQAGASILNEDMNPMSITGAKRALELSGKPHSTMDVFKSINDPDVYMPFMGFGPAPAYASKTSMQNRIGYLYGEHVAPVGRPYETKEAMEKRREARDKYLIARQKNDPVMLREATDEMVKAGIKPSSIGKLQPGTQDIYMFSRLPNEDQQAVLRESTQQEFKRYYPRAHQDVKKKSDILQLYRRHYRNQTQ